MLKAGFYSVPITPNVHYPMAGYDLRLEESTGVHDDIYVGAVVLDNGENVCVLCSFDLLGVPRKMVMNIRSKVSERIGILPNAIKICATHTHAAPQAIYREFACYDADYQEFIENAAVEAILRAYAEKSAVCACVSHTDIPGVGCYRDRVREESAHLMPCDTVWLQAENTQKRDILISVYACHPTVLNESNFLISSDLVYGCRVRMKELFPDADILFINGACADVSTRYTRDAADFDEVMRLGKLWADAMHQSLESVEPLTDEIVCKTETSFIPPADFFDKKTRSKVLVHLQKKIDACRDLQEQREYIACRSVLVRPSYGIETGCDAEVSVLKIGNVSFCFLPFEYADADAAPLRARLREKCGGEVVFCCYANGYEGYVPSGRPLDQDSGYEDIASPFRHDAKYILADAIENLV